MLGQLAGVAIDFWYESCKALTHLENVTGQTRFDELVSPTDQHVHVASDTSGVVERQHELVLRIDDEDGADGERKLLLIAAARINHAIGCRDGTVGISNDGELCIE